MALSDNLQGWWCPSLDTAGNGTTTLNDLSGNGNSGTLTNMDAATDWVADTDSGGVRALEFDRDLSQYVAMDRAALPLTGDFTLAFWFLYTSNLIGGVVSQYTLGVPGRTSVTINQSAIGFQVSNSLNFFSTGLQMSTTGLSLGTWYQVVLQRSSNQGLAYVNGTLVGTDTDWSTAIEDTAFAIGVSRLHLDGRVDSVAVWDIALTDDQVAQLYNGGRSLNLLGTGATQSIVPQLLLRRRRLSGGLVI